MAYRESLVDDRRHHHDDHRIQTTTIHLFSSESSDLPTVGRSTFAGNFSVSKMTL